MFEAGCEEDGEAGTSSGAGGWKWICEEILEAGCGEDGGAGTDSGIEFGKACSRLSAKRMEKLGLALELDLGRNSRGRLRRGWRGWTGLWSWIWEGILEVGCEEVGWIWEGMLEAG